MNAKEVAIKLLLIIAGLAVGKMAATALRNSGVNIFA
jgi:hypothetical protein